MRALAFLPCDAVQIIGVALTEPRDAPPGEDPAREQATHKPPLWDLSFGEAVPAGDNNSPTYLPSDRSCSQLARGHPIRVADPRRQFLRCEPTCQSKHAATVCLDIPVPFSLELLCCVVVSCVASCFGTSLQQCEAIRSPLESHGVHWSPMEITNMRDSSRGGRPRLHEANPACLGGECGIRFMEPRPPPTT